MTGGSCCTPPTARRCTRPWALAIGTRLAERYGIDAQALPSDDGIVLRIPETDQPPPGAEVVLFEPDEIEDLVTAEVGGSALFASRFRECAARALLLPRRDPGRRSPLWQQRQRSAQLLSVASKYPSFPIVLEAVREVLQDVYDVPALVGMMKDLSARRVKVAEVETSQPSPFARSLLFGYVAAFMYEGDNPLAERRAAALSLDQGLLAELLGRAELRELLDPQVLAELEAELQRLTPDRQARDAEGVADLLRLLGPLTSAEVEARSAEDPSRWLEQLATARRAVTVRMSGEERWAAVEDVGRLRDGLGVPVPPGTPEAFTDPVADPLADLVARHARTHGPFTATEVAERLGLGVAVAHQTLVRLAARAGCWRASSVRPGSGSEWCDAEVLRRLRRRSLAALRKEVEPVEPDTLGRFLPAWQHVVSTGSTGRWTPRSARRRRGARGRRAARRLRAARQRARAAGAGQPGGGLLPRHARRADHLRRGAVGRARHPARHRRLGVAAPGRLRRPDPARPRGGRLHAAARGAARGAGRVAAPTSSASSPTPPAGSSARPPRPTMPSSRRCGTWCGPVTSATTPSPRCGHSPPPAGRRTAPADSRRGPGSARGPAAASLPSRTGPGQHGRPLVAAARPRGGPHPSRPCLRRGAAGAARRGHPRRGDVRAGARRLRRGLQGALRLRGLRPLPSRATSSRAWAPPSSGHRAPSTGCVRSPATSPAATTPRSGPWWRWPPPTRPTPTAPRCPGRTGQRPRPRARRRPRTGSGHRPGRKAGAMVVLVDGALAHLRRARRPHPAHLHRRRRGPHRRRDRPRRRRTPGRAGQAAGRTRRRRAHPGPQGPAPRGAGERRVRGHPEGAEAACLRATPSGAPPGTSTGPSPARC